MQLALSIISVAAGARVIYVVNWANWRIVMRQVRPGPLSKELAQLVYLVPSPCNDLDLHNCSTASVTGRACSCRCCRIRAVEGLETHNMIS